MIRNRWMTTLSVIGLLITAFAAAPSAVYASAAGRKNTTLALGAAAIYSLLQHKTTQGLILGGGAYYAYTRYQAAHRRERSRSRLASYRGHRYHRLHR
jgi:hypothetical protein